MHINGKCILRERNSHKQTNSRLSCSRCGFMSSTGEEFSDKTVFPSEKGWFVETKALYKNIPILTKLVGKCFSGPRWSFWLNLDQLQEGSHLETILLARVVIFDAGVLEKQGFESNHHCQQDALRTGLLFFHEKLWWISGLPRQGNWKVFEIVENCAGQGN